MIKYNLRCDAGHEFEAWFNSMAGFDEQKEKGYLTCSLCGSTNVGKAIMAPRIRTSERQASEPSVDTSDYLVAEDMGDKFTQEIRDIKEGLAEERPIHGTASESQIQGLVEDGLSDGVVLVKKPTQQ